MRYRQLGKSGLGVSELALGTWAYGGDEWGPAHDDEAIATIHEALEAGINLLDTADVYGYGHSEEVVRSALEGRDEATFICSKAGNDIYSEERVPGGAGKNFSPPYLRTALEGTLSRLGVDALDLYILHNPPIEVIQAGDALGTLASFKAEGKIRSFGASVYTAEEGRAAIDTSGVDALMITYNILSTTEPRSLLEYAMAHDVGVITRSPLANGLLTGKYSPSSTFPAEDHRSQRGREWLAEGTRKVAALSDIAERSGRSITQMALAFVLSDSRVASVAIGARDRSQLRHNLRAVDLAPVESDVMHAISALTGVA